MARRKSQFHYAKPSSSYVHPSLAPKKLSNAEERSPRSVNDRIEHLRQIQGHEPVLKDRSGLGKSRYALVTQNQRRTPGPPPPRSWVVGDNDTVEDDELETSRPILHLSRLPGTIMPERGSLQDLCLKSIGRCIDWHISVDHVYLSVVPVNIKSQLLSYIAVYSSHGISKSGLEYMCLEPDDSTLDESSGIYELRRADLTRSLGRSLRFSELIRMWTKRGRRKPEQPMHIEVLDSWEDDADTPNLSLMQMPRFPRLTYLSLAHPSSNISWQDLLTFSAHLGSLTHLCLDFWPGPSLPQMQGVTARDKYLCDIPHSEKPRSEEEEEAAIILRIFSRNTSSLKWLSIAGCHSWFDALTPQADNATAGARTTESQPRAIDAESAPERSFARSNRLVRFDESSTNAGELGKARGPDWNGTWRHIRQINVSQDWIPSELRSHDLIPLVMHRKARSANREAVRADIFRSDREPEMYHLSSSSSEVQRQINERLRRNRWLLMERASIFLAARVDRKRLQGAFPTAEFDFGWGRTELLEAGYAEQLVFDAGL